MIPVFESLVLIYSYQLLCFNLVKIVYVFQWPTSVPLPFDRTGSSVAPNLWVCAALFLLEKASSLVDHDHQNDG
jgi:hypothetical protein